MKYFLVSFDIRFEKESNYSKFIEYATENGWSPWIETEEKTSYRLPGTTLYGSFINFEAAYDALENGRLCAEKNLDQRVLMEKRVIVEVLDIGLISNLIR